MASDLPELRASDAERERTTEVLRRAAGEGRLTMDELSDRVHAALEARTRAELDRLVADVVVPGGGDDPVALAERPPRMPVRPGEDGARWIVSILGGADRKGRWKLGARCTSLNVLGGADLDLNDAELASDVVELTVVSVLGGADVRVPDGVNVEVTDVAILGGNDTDLGEVRPDPGGPTVRIRLISVLGGTNVRRGRRRSRAERREQRELRRRRRHGLHG